MAASPGWQQRVLNRIGAPVTSNNVRALTAWQRAEGGGATNNPLNTTQSWGGASNYNSVGVKNYATPQAGAQATAHTLLNGRYGNIVGSLRSNANPRQTLTALTNSPWGTGSLALKVLGSTPAGSAPAAAPPSETGRSPLTRGNIARPDIRAQLASQLIGVIGQKNPDYTNIYSLVSQLHSPTSPNPIVPIPVVAQGGMSPRANSAVSLAKHFLGTPYVWGGESPRGFDCSGLLQYVWAKRGVAIPRTTYDQWKRGVAVGKGQLHPGDAVFFRGSDARGNLPGHVGMYIGGGKFIEAPHTGAVVRISNLAGRTDYQGARRYK